MSEHYFSDQPSGPEVRRMIRARLAGLVLALSLAAGSFGDGTRVMGTRPELVLAMCEGNRGQLLAAVDEALGRLVVSENKPMADAEVDRLLPEAEILIGQTAMPSDASASSSSGNCASRSGGTPALVLYPAHMRLRNDSIT